MKNIIITLLFFTFTLKLSAQNDTLIITHSYQKGLGLQLKWFPYGGDLFSKGLINGYKLYRAKVINDNGKEKLGSFELISDEIKPWKQNKFLEELGKDSSLKAAGLFVLNLDEIKNKSIPKTPREAVKAENQKGFLSMLGGFSALVNNKIADALGMYFIDKTYNPLEKYVYRLELNKSKNLACKIVFPFRENNFDKIVGLNATNDQNQVLLNWFYNQNSDYTYFNIYRSSQKNKDFEKLNTIPYIANNQNSKKNNLSSFIDSIPQFNTTYYYKIRGVNAFEEEGPSSEVVEFKATYLLKSAPMNIFSSTEDNQAIQLKWDYDKKDIEFVKEFKVKYSKTPNGPYQIIHKEMIKNSVKTYTDSRSKGSSNYYTICAYGYGNDSVCSILKAHILIDSMPPLPPVVLKGTCDSLGNVKIFWKKNQEPDFLGYRIFRTYDKKFEPTRLTKGSIADTFYTEKINTKEPYNKIYYTISAIDERFNPSPFSELIEVRIPDKKAPLNGYFIDYTVTMNGILLNWENSKVYDIQKMHLYRKSRFDANFEKINTINGDSLKNYHSYLDTNTKTNEKYTYVLQAEDESGLKSGFSKPMVVTQLNKDKVYPVTNLQGVVSSENKTIKLSWEYPYKAVGFKIYRAKNNEPLSTYTFVAANLREFYDNNLAPNSEYTYLIIAELPNDMLSGYSNKVMVKY